MGCGAEAGRAGGGKGVADLGGQEDAVGVELGERLGQRGGALGGRDLAVDDDAPLPLDLAQPATTRDLAGHRLVANLDAHLFGGLFQRLDDLLRLHVPSFLPVSPVAGKLSCADRSRSMIWAPPT